MKTKILEKIARLAEKRALLMVIVGLVITVMAAALSESLELKMNFTGEEVRYSYKLYETRLRYLYSLLETDEGFLKLGGGVSYIYNQLELESETTPDKTSQNTTETVQPFLSGSAGWWFAKNWGLFGDINWGQFEEQRSQDLTLGVMWQINPQWIMSGGYRYYDRIVEQDDWYNHLTQHQPFLSFGYYW